MRAARNISNDSADLNVKNERLSSKIATATEKKQAAIKEKKKIQRRERVLQKKVLTETEKDELINAQAQDIGRLTAQVRYWRKKHLNDSELGKCHIDIVDLEKKNDSLTDEVKKLTELLEDLEIQLKDTRNGWKR